MALFQNKIGSDILSASLHNVPTHATLLFPLSYLDLKFSTQDKWHLILVIF